MQIYSVCSSVMTPGFHGPWLEAVLESLASSSLASKQDPPVSLLVMKLLVT